MTDPFRPPALGVSWHPTTVARRRVAKIIGTPPVTVLVGEQHARIMGSLRTACGAYVPHWPMDLSRSFDPTDVAVCSMCASIVETSAQLS